MVIQEFIAKTLLNEAQIRTPRGEVAATPDEALAAAKRLAGAAVIKAQVPTGKRGKGGGILFAKLPEEAKTLAAKLLGSELGGYPVERVLVEEQLEIDKELYAAILNDPTTRGPLVLFSSEGGMDIEEVYARAPAKVVRHAIDIRTGLSRPAAQAILGLSGLDQALWPAAAEVLVKLYQLYRALDAELLEINPLIVDRQGALAALDCKLAIDDGARSRQAGLVALAEAASRPQGTELERKGRALGFLFIELDGSVGVLANGAGLTMATLDVVAHYGGRAANFLEIGGEAYTKAKPALELVLSNRKVKSLLINFCGAFARTDVMTEGVVAALEELRPAIPIAFSIHGTGEEEAIRMVRERLRIEPHEVMDDAVKAAIAGARSLSAAERAP